MTLPESATYNLSIRPSADFTAFIERSRSAHRDEFLRKIHEGARYLMLKKLNLGAMVSALALTLAASGTLLAQMVAERRPGWPSLGHTVMRPPGTLRARVGGTIPRPRRCKASAIHEI